MLNAKREPSDHGLTHITVFPLKSERKKEEMYPREEGEQVVIYNEFVADFISHCSYIIER